MSYQRLYFGFALGFTGWVLHSHVDSDLQHRSKAKYDTQNKNDVIGKSRQLLHHRMEEVGAPGLVVAVSVNGENVWQEGIGLADVENEIFCSPSTVMRIASISKSLTATVVSKLFEKGNLDLDAPIQKFIPDFPVKTHNGEEVDITMHHLLSHTSGIRHYKLKSHNQVVDEKTASQLPITNQPVNIIQLKNDDKLDSIKSRTKCDEVQNSKNIVENKIKDQQQIIANFSLKKKEKEENEFDLKEYYLKEDFTTIEDALKLFQDDELFFKPGEGFLYSTHGYTVVSRVIEKVTGKRFTEVMLSLFHELGMDHTYLDEHQPIIYNRTRYYVRDDSGKLLNAPYVNNSYKWAGGGILSTANDLVIFGNAMLYSYQHKNADLPGYLKKPTMDLIWKPVIGTKMSWDQDGGYGIGWGIVDEEGKQFGCGREMRRYISHTGGAVGASSVLLVLPKGNLERLKRKQNEMTENLAEIQSELKINSETSSVLEHEKRPAGVVVAILCNMQNVGLNKVALNIAKMFEQVT